jgi:mRNA-degrading endonuclease RelE of RelBE toxin-antitoxin system
MSIYSIEMTQDAREDLSYYAAAERKSIVTAIRQQLATDPLLETRNRKRLRDNPIATLELRVDRYRVFYEVDAAMLAVTIVSVGHKSHNQLYIRGKEVAL